MESSSPVLAAFGNPLWDLCVSLPNNGLLSEFGLADDSSTEVTAPEFESLLRSVESYSKKGCPGGAALNTIRIFQWLVGQQTQPKLSSVFFGSIGDDENGKLLTKSVSSVGVDVRFKIRSGQLTGSAICLIHNDLRTLVAHLGAANVYFPQDITQEDSSIIARVKVVYIENYFFSHSPSVVWDIVKLCKIQGVIIVFNLSGVYLFEKHAADIASLVKYVDIVVGNESEFVALANTREWKIYSDIFDLANKICAIGVQTLSSVSPGDIKPAKLRYLEDLGKVTVVTRGHKPILCAAEGNPLFSTPTLNPKFGVKDTTGAGDAFVAGFLMGIIHELPLSQCVHLGCYASTEIIQQIGCSPPENPPLTIEEIENNFLNH